MDDKKNKKIKKSLNMPKIRQKKKKESALDTSTIVTSLLPMVLKSAHTPVLDLA